MQYDEPVTQVKPNSSLEDVTYPWVIVSGYYFDIINTLHEFSACPRQGKTPTYILHNNFKTVKANEIYIN